MSRAGFLGRLIDKATENGNTIYEELQGNSVIASAVADWKEISKDTALGVKEDLDTAAAWISPTIDATPGKHTLEDTIDEFIFDPASQLAPLDLIGLGAASSSVSAARGARHAAKKVGMKVGGLFKRVRVKGDLVMQSLEEGTKREQELGRALTKVGRAARSPRKTIEGAVDTASKGLRDTADRRLRGQLLDATPEVRERLMKAHPDVRKRATGWEEFTDIFVSRKRKSAVNEMDRIGKTTVDLGKAAPKVAREVGDFLFNPRATPGEISIPTPESEILRTPFLSAVGGRERARKYFDE